MEKTGFFEKHQKALLTAALAAGTVLAAAVVVLAVKFRNYKKQENEDEES